MFRDEEDVWDENECFRRKNFSRRKRLQDNEDL